MCVWRGGRKHRDVEALRSKDSKVKERRGRRAETEGQRGRVA